MKHHQGLSLIEVLISFFILSLLLLGLDAMQLTALHALKSAYYFSVATQQLNNMAERWLTADDQEKDQHLAKWNQQNQHVLPAGRGIVDGMGPHYTITIYWGDLSMTTCNKKTIGEKGCLQLVLVKE